MIDVTLKNDINDSIDAIKKDVLQLTDGNFFIEQRYLNARGILYKNDGLQSTDINISMYKKKQFRWIEKKFWTKVMNKADHLNKKNITITCPSTVKTKTQTGGSFISQ